MYYIKANIAPRVSHENIPPNVRNVISHTATLSLQHQSNAPLFSMSLK